MEILSRDGSVPVYGELQVEGVRGRRTVLQAESGTAHHDVVVGQHLARVGNAVERKAKKTYPDGTALVVKVDDVLGFSEQADVDDLKELPELKLLSILAGREFCVLALEGTRDVHLAYDVPKTPS